MSRRITRDDRAMAIASLLESSKDGLNQPEILRRLGWDISRNAFSSALTHYRTHVGPFLERNIIYVRKDNVYVLQHEVGSPEDANSLAGYGKELRTRRITETISAHGIARTELVRAASTGGAELVFARIDERGLRRNLEDFGAFSDMIGDDGNAKRIEKYLASTA